MRDMRDPSPMPLATASERPFVTIVSGLPRSGTSLMMKMLESGGMPVLVDNIRAPDVDNPRGYYEYEPVKALKDDNTWVAASCGKAVKMVYLLIYDLPPGVEYRVLFMQRNLDEVLASQKVMLERLGKPARLEDARLAVMFRNHLGKFANWVKDRPDYRVLDVDYNALVADPEPIAAEINRFLGGGLNVAAMAGTVEPSLYRNRAT
jgi:hypothetical protein